MVETNCPECGSDRQDMSRVCESCGAPPSGEHREGEGMPVRTTDLEPYVGLRYVARLFKLLSGLIILMLIGEIAVGIMTEGRASLSTLIGEATRLLVIAGLLWAAGDLAVLLIDAGHDLRVSRILLGRINAKLHEPQGSEEETERRKVSGSSR